MVKKGIRGGICYAIYWYAKANNKYMKDYDENKESYLKYLDVSNVYSWDECHKSCLQMILKGMKKHLNIMKIS